MVPGVLCSPSTCTPPLMVVRRAATLWGVGVPFVLQGQSWPGSAQGGGWGACRGCQMRSNRSCMPEAEQLAEDRWQFPFAYEWQLAAAPGEEG